MLISDKCWTEVSTLTDEIYSDCPHVFGKDGFNLEACEAKALELGGNAINWKPSGDNCNVKRCSDPNNPQLKTGYAHAAYVYKTCTGQC